MTEEEAKTKWCPMARMETRGGGTAFVATPAVYPEKASCLGSACMMWRQEARIDREAVRVYADAHALTTREAESRLGTNVPVGPGDGGYCGLAGKP